MLLARNRESVDLAVPDQLSVDVVPAGGLSLEETERELRRLSPGVSLTRATLPAGPALSGSGEVLREGAPPGAERAHFFVFVLVRGDERFTLQYLAAPGRSRALFFDAVARSFTLSG